MACSKWVVQPDVVLSSSPVIPVISIKELKHAIPLATACFAGGMHVLEITLRTSIALDAVQLLVKTFPNALIGVGTVIMPDQLKQAIDVGAKFAFSPGKTQVLLEAGCYSDIPLIPGVSSFSELMEGLALGYTHFKFFPAVTAGGVNMLKAMHGLFPQVKFCPTGGINESNFFDYLMLPNVACVGGSWLVPEDAVKKGHWSLITDLCCSVRKTIRVWD